MTRRRIVLLAAFAIVSIAWLAGHAVGDVGVGILHLLPAAAIIAPLLLGRYLGADRLVALAARRTGRRRPARTAGRAKRAPGILPRGGRLLAASLAERGPPALLPARV
jgi:hypothetical protein